MSLEKAPNTIDTSAGRVFNRMSRIFTKVPESIPLWNALVLEISPSGIFSYSQFLELCNRASISMEALVESSDEDFDTHFEEIVGFMRERLSLPSNPPE